MVRRSWTAFLHTSGNAQNKIFGKFCIIKVLYKILILWDEERRRTNENKQDAQVHSGGLCTLLLAGTPEAQAAFQDTEGHWAESAIGRMNDYRIVNGYQGKFHPDETITRGEMVVVLDPKTM